MKQQANTLNHSQKVARKLKIKTRVKAGGMSIQHNQKVARNLKIKTRVKAGGFTLNHNQTAMKAV